MAPSVIASLRYIAKGFGDIPVPFQRLQDQRETWKLENNTFKLTNLSLIHAVTYIPYDFSSPMAPSVKTSLQYIAKGSGDIPG